MSTALWHRTAKKLMIMIYGTRHQKALVMKAGQSSGGYKYSFRRLYQISNSYFIQSSSLSTYKTLFNLPLRQSLLLIHFRSRIIHQSSISAPLTNFPFLPTTTMSPLRLDLWKPKGPARVCAAWSQGAALGHLQIVATVLPVSPCSILLLFLLNAKLSSGVSLLALVLCTHDLKWP